MAVRGIHGCSAPGDAAPGKIDVSAFVIQHLAVCIQHSAFTFLWPLFNSTNSSAAIRTSPSARPICGAIFDGARPADELARVEQQAAAPDFWKDQASAQKVMQRRRRLEDDISLSGSLKRRVDDLAVLVEWAQAGEPVGDELTRGLDELGSEVESGETKKMLGGEHDRKNAIITIHPGAGGTESQDWAEMLLRMYMRWAEQKSFHASLVDSTPGEEAGIKSATVLIEGENAYGLLSGESGVHRLVRISPFDQAARRHNTLAGVALVSRTQGVSNTPRLL